MSRKKAREVALHLIFERSFQDIPAEEIAAERLEEANSESIGGEIALYTEKLDERDKTYITQVLHGIELHQAELDAQIEKNARGWQMKRLSKMTLSVLRLALYEMRYVEDVPVGAAINEAVDLAKLYESDEAGAFINGILGTISREQR